MKNSFAFTLLGQACLFVALLLGGCTKESDPTPARPACKLTKQYWSSSNPDTYLKYEYGAGDQMVKFTAFEGGTEQRTYACEYDSQGRLTKVHGRSYWSGDGTTPRKEVTGVATYTYNTRGVLATVVETSYIDNAPTPAQVITIACEYDAQGNRTKVSSDNPAAPIMTLFEYRDGNCIKATHQAGTAMESVYEYEYYLDQDNKMRTAHPENAYLRHTPNRNLLKRTTYAFKSSPTSRTFTDYSYEFNPEGFPVKILFAVSNTDGMTPYSSYEVREYACPQ
jgi:hypothetical protein